MSSSWRSSSFCFSMFWYCRYRDFKCFGNMEHIDKTEINMFTLEREMWVYARTFRVSNCLEYQISYNRQRSVVAYTTLSFMISTLFWSSLKYGFTINRYARFSFERIRNDTTWKNGHCFIYMMIKTIKNLLTMYQMFAINAALLVNLTSPTRIKCFFLSSSSEILKWYLSR